MKIDTSTTAGKDKKLASLYLARSKGKIIQHRDAIGRWFDTTPNSEISYSFRIKPITVEDAAKEYSKSKSSIVYCRDDVELGFIDGVKWRDENPKDQDNDV